MRRKKRPEDQAGPPTPPEFATPGRLATGPGAPASGTRAEPERAAATRESPLEAVPPREADSPATRPDPDRIAARAYELYLERGGEHGRAMDDWLTAEEELARRPKRE